MPDHAAHSISEYMLQAQQRLPAGIWNYLADGDSAGDLRALAEVRLMPRPLCDVRGGHTRLTLFGQQLDHPVLLGPVAYQRLFHAEGEAASAMAASAQGGQMIISSLASQTFAQIVNAADQPAHRKPWFQLYWQGDRERTLHLLHRAIAAGCAMVVVTVDAPIKVAGLQLPADIHAVNSENFPLPVSGASMVFDGWMDKAPTWDDLAWLRQQTDLPLLVKGLLHPDDAERALAAGCDGIVVSTHGGRVLRGAPLSLLALKQIATRINGRVPVLFDSGIRSGRDVFTALACGATAVLVGRPYVWGLAADGAIGVARVIRLLRDELEMTMALTGCRHLADIGEQCLAGD